MSYEADASPLSEFHSNSSTLGSRPTAHQHEKLAGTHIESDIERDLLELRAPVPPPPGDFIQEGGPG